MDKVKYLLDSVHSVHISVAASGETKCMNNHIILAPDKEDILVFLTGQEEIEAMARDIRLIANDSSTSGSSTNLLFQNNNTTYQPNKKLVVLPLYASQQLTIMNKIMNPTDKRKIILATNIAETSLTIPRVKHVIDSCRVKAKSHHASTGLGDI